MSTLNQTISTALQSAGTETRDRLQNILGDFNGANLTAEERLIATATAIAAIGRQYHARHVSVYLEAVRTWALEISNEASPAPIRLHVRADLRHSVEAAEILISGVDGLLEYMSGEGIGMQDRLVTELAVVTRLLGQYDANIVHFTLRSVESALAQPDYRVGDLVEVPVREIYRPLSRSIALEELAPVGSA